MSFRYRLKNTNFGLFGFVGLFLLSFCSFGCRTQEKQLTPEAKAISQMHLAETEKTIEENPQNVKAYIESGNLKLFQKDYSGAIQDFDKAIQLDPRNYEAYYARGNAKFDSGREGAAKEDYEAFLRYTSHLEGDIQIKNQRWYVKRKMR